MADFFARLAERALGLAAVAQPDLPSMFAPAAQMETSAEVIAGRQNASAERATPANAAPVTTSRNLPPQAQSAPPIETARRDAGFHPPLVNFRQAARDSSGQSFPIAVEDVNFKSERRRSIDDISGFDRARSTAEDSRPKAVSGERIIAPPERAAMPDPKAFAAVRTENAAPTIQVSIGRVEVRAVTPPAQTQRVVERKAPAILSLDQYLRERNEGRR